MPTPVFYGRVLSGGLLVVDTPRDYARHLRSLHDQWVEVTVRRKRSQRSLKQNAYLHAVVFPLVAEAIGDSIEETKRALMGTCWGWRMNNLRQQVPLREHTADLDTVEAQWFIDWVIPWAATTLGLQIPLPGEAE